MATPTSTVSLHGGGPLQIGVIAEPCSREVDGADAREVFTIIMHVVGLGRVLGSMLGSKSRASFGGE